ncbi:MAG: flagellar biosynthetic protein FliO [Planctomycetota bacterium]|nr:MAG: flagellar biosynthetic protein FliO [Planctomycetota bacterium]
MARYKKKIVAFLAAVALCGGVLVVCHAQSAPAEAAKPSFENPNPIFAKDPNLITKGPDSLDTRELFFKLMVSVLLVIALGVAAIYASKRLLPKITNLPGRKIHVIETVHLGPRKSVHLVKIGNQRILIGSTNESITKLADINDAFSEIDLPSQQIDNLRI